MSEALRLDFTPPAEGGQARAPAAPPSIQPGRWSFTDLAGRLVEISGPASITLAFGLLRQTQQRREPCAWITRRDSVFFPPDAHECGVDLAALPVVQVDEATSAARAADHLLRSGAFGLVVIDLGRDERLPPALPTRLVGLARKHEAAVLFLTQKPRTAPSISSLVSLRACTWREPLRDGRYACGLLVLKDKRHGTAWSHEERRRAPTGVC